MLLAEAKVRSQDAKQGGIGESVVASEYTLLEKVQLFSGSVDAFDIYYPRVRNVDLRVDVPKLEVPAYFVDGDGEVPARVPPMRQWFAELRAPHKEHLLLADSGHRSMYERPTEFIKILTHHVLAETSKCQTG